MAFIVRAIIRFCELLLAVPMAVARFAMGSVIFNPKLGPLRHVATAAVVYVGFALLLVYVVAPVRGFIGARTMGDQLRYASERWLATAVYDKTGRLLVRMIAAADSMQDVNYTERDIGSASTWPTRITNRFRCGSCRMRTGDVCPGMRIAISAGG